MFGQKLLVDSRFVVEALQETVGNELDEVLVPLIVLAKQNQVMVGLFPLRGCPVGMAVPSDIDFAADDGLDARLRAVS